MAPVPPDPPRFRQLCGLNKKAHKSNHFAAWLESSKLLFCSGQHYLDVQTSSNIVLRWAVFMKQNLESVGQFRVLLHFYHYFEWHLVLILMRYIPSLFAKSADSNV